MTVPAEGALLFAFDLGTTTGWAVYQYGGTRTTRWWWRASGAVKLGSDGPTRLSNFQQLLTDLEKKFGRPQLLAYEKVYRHLGTQACHVYGSLEGLVMLKADELKCGLWPVPVQHVKKAATGKGNAPKEPVLLAAREKIYVGIQTHDEADACWVAEVASVEAYRADSGDGEESADGGARSGGSSGTSSRRAGADVAGPRARAGADRVRKARKPADPAGAKARPRAASRGRAARK